VRRRGVCGIAQSMNSETPKKSPLLTSVNKGKKGQSHYAYYTPTQRTSKREGYWTKQIGTGTWYEVSESWPCAGTLLPSAVLDGLDQPAAAIHSTAWKGCSPKFALGLA